MVVVYVGIVRALNSQHFAGGEFGNSNDYLLIPLDLSTEQLHTEMAHRTQP